jgi:hypothetical protein
MNSKTLILALKSAVRQVIKEELTEILREGLQSTIIEQKQQVAPTVNQSNRSRTQFKENKWADILNETNAINDDAEPITSFASLMNEGIDEINMTSKDAQGFGMMRNNMKQSQGIGSTIPKTMEDPETGELLKIPPEVARAITRDYSDLMKVINKQKVT